MRGGTLTSNTGDGKFSLIIWFRNDSLRLNISNSAQYKRDTRVGGSSHGDKELRASVKCVFDNSFERSWLNL